MIDGDYLQGGKGSYRMGVRGAYTRFCCRVGGQWWPVLHGQDGWVCV